MASTLALLFAIIPASFISHAIVSLMHLLFLFLHYVFKCLLHLRTCLYLLMRALITHYAHLIRIMLHCIVFQAVIQLAVISTQVHY